MIEAPVWVTGSSNNVRLLDPVGIACPVGTYGGLADGDVLLNLVAWSRPRPETPEGWVLLGEKVVGAGTPGEAGLSAYLHPVALPEADDARWLGANVYVMAGVGYRGALPADPIEAVACWYGSSTASLNVRTIGGRVVICTVSWPMLGAPSGFTSRATDTVIGEALRISDKAIAAAGLVGPFAMGAAHFGVMLAVAESAAPPPAQRHKRGCGALL